MLIGSIGVLIVVFVSASLLDFLGIKIPNSLFHAAQAVGLASLAQLKLGTTLQDHKKEGGAFHSNWKALGIALLFMAVIMGLIFLVIVATGEAI